MKGHVPTPDGLADKMVDKLFSDQSPSEGDRILYPGMGTGPFVGAVERYCKDNDVPIPDGVGVELDPEHIETARERHADSDIEILEADFLSEDFNPGSFEYIVGNPPYVAIEGLDEDEKSDYKGRFDTAIGRFDLYILFFERCIDDMLADSGRLVFVTPEKYTYVDTGEALRRVMRTYDIKELEYVPEDSFDGYITFPLITTITNDQPGETRIVRRDGTERTVELPKDGSSWASTIRGGADGALDSGVTLGDVTKRISCGVATGADSVFVVDENEVPTELEEWTCPTVSGSQLREFDGPYTDSVFVCPYDSDGNLTPEDQLGAFGDWAEDNRDRLEDRSCVEGGKAWYAWHENPPMEDILQPKVVCKDVSDPPEFWVEDKGNVVPRHSVYYIIPEDDVPLDELCEYLNSDDARVWLEAHCQKAHNDYLRLQSKVLRKLPVPERFGESYQATLV